MVIVVSDVVKVAVNIEQIQTPIKIQATAKVRPRNDLGARSPYLQDFHIKLKHAEVVKELRNVQRRRLLTIKETC